MKAVLLLCSVLVFSADTVKAALVEADWLTPGDKLLTIDTETDLAWLDLTSTTGLSYNDVISDVGGYMSSGFRYAFRAEVETLWNNAGFPLTDPFSDPIGEEYSPAVAQLQSLMGITRIQGSNQVSHGLYLENEFSPVGDNWIYAGTLATGDGATWAYTEGGLSLAQDESSSIVGSYLVYEPLVVPVPPAILLFGSGLVCLVGIARRKKLMQAVQGWSV